MKKIILYILIICLACQVAGCKGAGHNENKDSKKVENVQTEKEDEKSDEQKGEQEKAGDVTDKREESGTSAQTSDSTSNQNKTPTPAPTPAPSTTQKVPSAPKPPVSSNQNTSNEAGFGSSEVVEVEDVEEVEIPKVDAEITTVDSHKALAMNQYYQYSGLSGSEKKIYNAIYEGIKQCETYINLSSYSCTKDILDKVYHAVTGDNPQFFYLTNLYAYSGSGSKVDKLILLYMDGTKSDGLENGTVKANANRNTISQQIASFNNKINDILKLIPNNVSEIQKEKIIYEYLQDNIVYDYKAADLIYSDSANASHAFDVYGAACEKKAVCEGYAELFQFLCYCVGMNATQVSGTANGGPHMWNAVCIDSNWYMLDVTWDDGGTNGMHYYTYFNLTTNDMVSMNHTPDTTNLRVPSCTSKEHAFYKDFALYVENLEAAPSNYKKVLDYVASQQEKVLCIYSEAGSDKMQDYLSKQIYGAKSDVQKYIKSKGYAIVFESQYYISGKYFYIQIK